MEDILKHQNQLMSATNDLLTNFKKDGADRKTPSRIKNRIETLDSYWKDFQHNHNRLLEYEDQNHAYFIENCYDRTVAFYKDARTYLVNYYESRKESSPLIKPATLAIPKHVDNPSAPTSPANPAGPKSPLQYQTVTFDLPSVSGKSEATHFTSTGTNSKLDEMLRYQKSNFKAFSHTISNIDYGSMTERYELEEFLKSINSRWSAIDSLHWKIDSEMQEENLEYENAYNQYEKKYREIKKQVILKMSSASHRERATPQTEIPIFSNDFHKWVTFKDLYTEAIHNNGSMSDCQKMQFLKSKLRGEAEQIVSHLHITSDNYKICWEILNNRFQNNKLIFGSYIGIITNLPVMQQQSIAQLKRMHDSVVEALSSIKNMGIDIKSWDPIVMYLLEEKLDHETKKEYCASLKNPKDLPSVRDFIDFLASKFISLESTERTNMKQNNATRSGPQTGQSFQKSNNYQKPTISKSNHFNYNQRQMNNIIQKQTQTGCKICKKEHGIYHCSEFLKLLPTERKDIIAKLKLCFNCLNDHFGKRCLQDKCCRTCQARHNTLLHDAFVNKLPTENDRNRNVTHVIQDDFSEILLATAMVNVTSADGTIIKLRALIDQGSQISLISENAAQMLKLPRQWCKGVIFGVGAKENNCKGVLHITCASIYNEYQFDTDVCVMKQLINNLPSRTFSKPAWSSLEGIQLADPEYNVNRPVDLLLGADVYSRIMLSGFIPSDQSMPVAQQTKLGWILCGNVKSYQCNVIVNNVEEIQRFWEIEDIPSDNSLSQEDAYCLEYFKNTTTRQPDGKYVVRLPLIPKAKEYLGESKSKAVAQFKQLENKFAKNQDIEKDYKSFIHEYMDLKHMLPLSVSNNMKPVYLPHHCVIKDSTTTALRVVFNASSKTSSGRSLNDVMLRGPNLQQDIMSLIIKWRQYRFAYTADIEKMFRFVAVHPADQHLQTVLWRDSPSDYLKQYQLSTVTYGTKAAPFLAMMVLKQLADDEGHKFQKSTAAKTLKDSFYMDDLLSGNHDIQSAKQLQNDLIQLLQAGGLNLRKWTSNTTELLQNVSTASMTEQSYDFNHDVSTKTFGLRWHPHSDEFTFDQKINMSDHKRYTKRNLLSDISKLFDPLGWLTPVTTKFKLLFQLVWLHNVGWDDELPSKIYNEWLKIRGDLKNINEIRIPRWLQTCKNDVIELHGYCDSSIHCYACVIYCKVMKENQNNSVVLVAAKSRLVPPNKGITLPRLELSATLLLSQLMRKVQSCLSEYKIKIFGWCDSTAVLGWLQGDPGRWKTFVANRVVQVTKVLPPETWRYVKSSENPADCASRGITMEQLSKHPLWWRGPKSLSTFNPDQPNQHFITDEEIKKTKQSNVTITYAPEDDVILSLLDKNSCWSRVTRIIAYVLRFKQNNKQTFLTVTELKTARLKIIKHVQSIEFDREITSLLQNKQIDSKSKILCLTPFLDQEGLLRVGGRIRNAFISKDMMHPLILPHKHRMTTLLIDHAHHLTYHGGPRVTLARLRQQYWILGGNQAVKFRLRRCIICRRNNPSKHSQIMGNLPEARINPSRPFHHTGVDFTGHVFVKASKGRGMKTYKGYISVFICMATKAVHLELVSDLTASAFLAALRRMAARRGAPAHIYSDNGTNFVGANRVLKQEAVNLKNMINEEFLSKINEMEITWHFGTPLNPSANGLWERAVRSLKHHLRRVIGEQKLTFEEYTTLLAQLEACLNSRPLCPLTEDPDDVDYLTPSHFLSSGPVLSIIETERDQRTRWQLTQKIFGDIWKRWKAEYLTQLSSRSKWLQPKPNMKVDDVVVIHDANLPPGRWALGRVIELHPGTDGYVRVVTVKTKNGTIKRPITKLSILPVYTETIETQKHEDVDQNDINEQVPKVTNKRKQSTYKLTNFIFTLLLMFTMCSQSIHCAYNVTYFQENQALYFDQLSNMRLIRDQWKVIVYYDMKPYWIGSKLLLQYINHLDGSCSKQKQRAQCDVVLLQLRHGYTELQYYAQLLLSQHSSSSITRRVRRGLINGVGNVAHALFGVLDDDFAQQYQEDIELVRKNQQHLANLWKNQTSVIEAQFNFLKRMEITVETQRKLFNQHLKTLENQNNILKHEIENTMETTEFTLSSVIANNILNNLKQIQDTLLDTVTDIYHGKFNIHILSPDQLRDELSTISCQLSKEVALPIDDIHSGAGLSKLYQLLRVKVRVTDQYLLFEIKIPLVTRENYDIFKVIPIPQMVEAKMVNIVPVAEFMAINIQHDSYLPMTDSDLQTCSHLDQTTKLCELQSPIYHLPSGQMLWQKFVTRQTITKQCENNWNALNNINEYMFYCCEECAIRIMCSGQVTLARVIKAGLLSISSDCVLKGDKFTIYSHNHHVNNLHVKADVITIDIPQVNHIINLTVPFNNDEIKTDVEVEDQQKSLNAIQKQIEQMKTEKAEIDQMSKHDLHHYVVTYTLVAVCLGAIFAFLIKRVRRARGRGSRSQERCVAAEPATAATTGVPAPPPLPTPTPAPRNSISDISRACVDDNQVDSVPSESSVCVKPKIVSVLYKKDKATVPSIPSRVFPIYHQDD